MLILNQCYSGFLLKILFNSIDPKATSAGFAERALRNIWPGLRGSLRLDVSSVDHLRPLGGIRLDYHSNPLRRIEGRLKTELRQALAHVGLRRDLRDFCVHLADDGSRRAGWRQQPEQRDGLELRKARLRKRWQVGNDRRALERCDRKPAELAIANDRQDPAHVLQRHRHPPANYVGKDRAAIGNVDDVDASETLEQFAGDVLGSADTGRCKRELSGLGFS